MRIGTLLIPLILALQTTAVAATSIRIATSADTYPYNFGKSDGCTGSSGVCGFEIDLFNAICSEMHVTCTWVISPWEAIFDGLLKPDTNGAYAYDAIVASTEASPERRSKMLFSASYYSAKHLFVGRTALSVKFDINNYYPLDHQDLRIGTWSGYMQDALVRVYANSKLIKIIAVSDPIEALKKSEIDLAFVYTGIGRRLLEDPRFEQKGRSIPTEDDDPFGGTAAASRISLQGREIEQLFSQGLVRIRKNGTYSSISKRWMGDDIWNCRQGPQIKDPACVPSAKPPSGFERQYSSR